VANETHGVAAETHDLPPVSEVACDHRHPQPPHSFAVRGPTPDTIQLPSLLNQLGDGVRIDHLLADAGYDSEANHVLLREGHGIRSTIPPKQGRPRQSGLPSSLYRRLMCQRFDAPAYRQRSQVETVMSMLKRNLDGCIRARTYWSQIREMALKVLTHNLMILWLATEVFYRAGQAYLMPKSYQSYRFHPGFETGFKTRFETETQLILCLTS